MALQRSPHCETAQRMLEVHAALRDNNDPPFVELASPPGQLDIYRSGDRKPVMLVASLFHVYLFKDKSRPMKLYRSWPIQEVTLTVDRDDLVLRHNGDDSENATAAGGGGEFDGGQLDRFDKEGTDWKEVHLGAAESVMWDLCDRFDAVLLANLALTEPKVEDFDHDFSDASGSESDRDQLAGAGPSDILSSDSDLNDDDDINGERKKNAKGAAGRGKKAAAAKAKGQNQNAAGGKSALTNTSADSAQVGRWLASGASSEFVDYSLLAEAYAQNTHEQGPLQEARRYTRANEAEVSQLCSEHYRAFLSAADRCSSVDTAAAAQVSADISRQKDTIGTIAEEMLHASTELISSKKTVRNIAVTENAVRAVLDVARLLEQVETQAAAGQLTGAVKTLAHLKSLIASGLQIVLTSDITADGDFAVSAVSTASIAAAAAKSSSQAFLGGGATTSGDPQQVNGAQAFTDDNDGAFTLPAPISDVSAATGGRRGARFDGDDGDQLAGSRRGAFGLGETRPSDESGHGGVGNQSFGSVGPSASGLFRASATSELGGGGGANGGLAKDLGRSSGSPPGLGPSESAASGASGAAASTVSGASQSLKSRGLLLVSGKPSSNTDDTQFGAGARGEHDGIPHFGAAAATAIGSNSVSQVQGHNKDANGMIDTAPSLPPKICATLSRLATYASERTSDVERTILTAASTQFNRWLTTIREVEPLVGQLFVNHGRAGLVPPDADSPYSSSSQTNDGVSSPIAALLATFNIGTASNLSELSLGNIGGFANNAPPRGANGRAGANGGGGGGKNGGSLITTTSAKSAQRLIRRQIERHVIPLPDGQWALREAELQVSSASLDAAFAALYGDDSLAHATDSLRASASPNSNQAFGGGVGGRRGRFGAATPAPGDAASAGGVAGAAAALAGRRKTNRFAKLHTDSTPPGGGDTTTPPAVSPSQSPAAPPPAAVTALGRGGKLGGGGLSGDGNDAPGNVNSMIAACLAAVSAHASLQNVFESCQQSDLFQASLTESRRRQLQLTLRYRNCSLNRVIIQPSNTAGSGAGGNGGGGDAPLAHEETFAFPSNPGGAAGGAGGDDERALVSGQGSGAFSLGRESEVRNVDDDRGSPSAASNAKAAAPPCTFQLVMGNGDAGFGVGGANSNHGTQNPSGHRQNGNGHGNDIGGGQPSVSTVWSQIRGFERWSEMLIGHIACEDALFYASTAPRLRTSIDIVTCWSEISTAVVSRGRELMNVCQTLAATAAVEEQVDGMQAAMAKAAAAGGMSQEEVVAMFANMPGGGSSTDGTNPNSHADDNVEDLLPALFHIIGAFGAAASDAVSSIEVDAAALITLRSDIRDGMHAILLQGASQAIGDCVANDTLVPMMIKTSDEFQAAAARCNTHLAPIVPAPMAFPGTAVQLPYSRVVPAAADIIIQFVNDAFDIVEGFGPAKKSRNPNPSSPNMDDFGRGVSAAGLSMQGQMNGGRGRTSASGNESINDKYRSGLNAFDDHTCDEMILGYVGVLLRNLSSSVRSKVRSGEASGVLHSATVAANCAALMVVASTVEQHVVMRWHGHFTSDPCTLGTPALLGAPAADITNVASIALDACAQAIVAEITRLLAPASHMKYWRKVRDKILGKPDTNGPGRHPNGSYIDPLDDSATSYTAAYRDNATDRETVHDGADDDTTLGRSPNGASVGGFPMSESGSIPRSQHTHTPYSRTARSAAMAPFGAVADFGTTVASTVSSAFTGGRGDDPSKTHYGQTVVAHAAGFVDVTLQQLSILWTDKMVTAQAQSALLFLASKTKEQMGTLVRHADMRDAASVRVAVDLFEAHGAATIVDTAVQHNVRLPINFQQMCQQLRKDIDDREVLWAEEHARRLQGKAAASASMVAHGVRDASAAVGSAAVTGVKGVGTATKKGFFSISRVVGFRSRNKSTNGNGNGHGGTETNGESTTAVSAVGGINASDHPGDGRNQNGESGPGNHSFGSNGHGTPRGGHGADDDAGTHHDTYDTSQYETDVVTDRSTPTMTPRGSIGRGE